MTHLVDPLFVLFVLCAAFAFAALFLWNNRSR